MKVGELGGGGGGAGNETIPENEMKQASHSLNWRQRAMLASRNPQPHVGEMVSHKG